MFKIRNLNTFSFRLFEHLNFGIVSDFDIRISNFLNFQARLVPAMLG